MTRLITLLSAATIAAFAFAGAGSAAATLPFNVSMTVEAGTLPGGCCSDSTTGVPTSVVVPGIGRATLTAEFGVCGVVGCFPDGECRRDGDQQRRPGPERADVFAHRNDHPAIAGRGNGLRQLPLLIRNRSVVMWGGSAEHRPAHSCR